MNQLQSIKRVAITPPGAIVNGASYTTTAIDTQGYNQLCVTVLLGAVDAAMTAFKLQESDDSGMSGPADITGCVFGTSTDPDTGATSALPLATQDNKFFSFFVNLTGRKRYIDLVATIDTGVSGGYLTAWADLAVGDEVPYDATTRGLAAGLIA